MGDQLTGNCTYEGCERPIDYKKKQICHKHYNQEWREANPEKVIAATKAWREANPEASRAHARATAAKYRHNPVYHEHITDKVKERFFAKVDKTDSCWNWTGAISATRPARRMAPAKQGYGVISINNRPFYVHRLAWMMKGNDLIEGLVIDHLCNNSLCVNPDHLDQVTNEQNTLRSPLHSANGAKYYYSKDKCKYGHVRTPENKGKACFTCYPVKKATHCKNGHPKDPARHGKKCQQCYINKLNAVRKSDKPYKPRG